MVRMDSLWWTHYHTLTICWYCLCLDSSISYSVIIFGCGVITVNKSCNTCTITMSHGFLILHLIKTQISFGFMCFITWVVTPWATHTSSCTRQNQVFSMWNMCFPYNVITMSGNWYIQMMWRGQERLVYSVFASTHSGVVMMQSKIKMMMIILTFAIGTLSATAIWKHS